jgi:diphthine-ammonia ligase
MLVVGLLSGGKDSCYNLVQCVAAGHEVVALANLRPSRDTQEEDSNMYQTVGWNCVELLARAMRLPLYVETITGEGREMGKDYLPTEGDEVEDLYRLLKRVARETGVKGVAVGAILSDYQRVRVESVCLRLGLTPLAYLWQRDQAELLGEMVRVGMESVLVKVACLGLEESHLGKT